MASDLLGVNPLLGPLQDNGGPTETVRGCCQAAPPSTLAALATFPRASQPTNAARRV